MGAVMELLVRSPGQSSAMVLLTVVVLVCWSGQWLYRSGYRALSLGLLVAALALDPAVLILVHSIHGNPHSAAVYHYAGSLDWYLAPWIACGICFLLKTGLLSLTRGKPGWLLPAVFGVLFVIAHATVVVAWWKGIDKIHHIGWGLQYAVLLPGVLLVAFLEALPLQSDIPPGEYRQRADHALPRTIAFMLVMLAIFPLFASPYLQHSLAMIGITAIALYGLNLLTGLCGQISLAQWALVGIGAYTTAILNVKFDYGLAYVLPASALICATAALLIGLFSFLRIARLGTLTAIIAALATPAFVSLAPITGGPRGLLMDKQNSLVITYCILFIAAITIVAYRLIFRSTLGQKLMAVRQHQLPSTAHAYLLRLLAFTVSGFLAGIAGSLYALHLRFVNPAMFSAFESNLYVCTLLIGAMGTQLGPLGAIVFAWIIQQGVFGALDIYWGRVIVFPMLAVSLALAYRQGLHIHLTERFRAAKIRFFTTAVDETHKASGM